MTAEDPKPQTDGELRPHSFDGIQEYDKRMPNWWLWTLYGAIAYSVGYWAFYHAWNLGEQPGYALEQTMKENAIAAARSTGVVDDELLWTLSKDLKVIEAGKLTYAGTCASCHQVDLSGGIGPNLKDAVWIHGGGPLQISDVISKGVLAKGMPTWAPVLGKSKITEVTAYILSFHQKPAKVTQVPGGGPVVGSLQPSK